MLYFINFLSVTSGILITALYEKHTKGIEICINGYHLHHSLYGVLLIIVSIFLYILKTDVSIIFPIIGFSLGNILQHTKKEKFVFIDKNNDLRKNRLFKERGQAYKIVLIKRICTIEVLRLRLPEPDEQKWAFREGGGNAADIDYQLIRKSPVAILQEKK